MTVLILTEECDPTADRVVDELTRRDVPVFRCDTAWFPNLLTVDAQLDNDRWSGVLRTPHRRVALADLRSVWYRRPSPFSFPTAMSGPERQHAAWEAKFGLGGVLTSLPVLWVNHPSRESDACYKPRQLATAAQCGLAVPQTLVTNDPQAVRSFAERLDDGVVVKMLGSNAINERGGAKVCYTHPLSVDDLSDLSGVEVTAHLFQQRVADKAYEVRLTAVGDALFAAAIHAASEASRSDWRADLGALRYRSVEVPKAVADGVHAYLSAFGLSYGAFDFVVDHEGHYTYLECNPGGQFGWIEANTGLPITSTLADLLEKGLQ
jgi:ATP-grasp ribosomal peptide maturase